MHAPFRSDDSLMFWLFDVASVVAFVAFQIWGWLHIAATTNVPHALLLPLFAASCVLSWVASDFASGLVHYAADHWGSERTPVVGRFLIAPFRRHHESPLEMLDHGFFERNGNCALIALLALVWVPLLAQPGLWGTLLAMSSLCLGWWTLGTNQIHSWAHATARPRWVTILQQMGLILSSEHHRVHHAPFDQWGPSSSDTVHVSSANYCITHGNCEFLLQLLVHPRRASKRSSWVKVASKS